MADTSKSELDAAMERVTTATERVASLRKQLDAALVSLKTAEREFHKAARAAAK